MNTRLQKSFRKSDKKKENKVTLLSGELGIPLNGQRLVEVPNRQGFVFVRLKNNTSELIQAYNAAVSPIYDLPVLVARQVGGYKIVGRNIDRYTNQWGNAPFLPKHGAQHSFNPDINIGGDIVWVYSQQMMPLLAYPSGSSGSPRLTVAPYIIRDMNGAWKYVGNTGTPDTTPYNPTTGSRAVIGLVYLDTVSGNPQLLINSGTYIDASLTGTNQIVDYIPRTTNPNWIPLAGIRLVSGSTQLSWNNVYDVRPFLQVIPTGTSSSSGGGGGGGGIGVVGWDEGIYQATGTILNVTGQRGTLTASGTVLNLVLSPDPQELIGVYGLSNGTPLGTGTWIDFGNNLTASISGTVIRVDASSSGGTTGTITIQDEGITQGNVSTLNFVGSNVQATVSGNTATINVTGSSGGSAWTQNISESGASFTNWTSLAGNWRSDGTVIMQTGTAATVYEAKYNTKQPNASFIYEAEIQLKNSGATKRGGLILGFNGSTGNGPLVIYLDQNGTLALENNAQVVILSFGTTVNINTWYKVRVFQSGRRTAVWLDNTLVMTSDNGGNVNDVSYLGLYAYQEEVWFRNIKSWTPTFP